MAQDYFRALRDVALVINSSLEPGDVLHRITEQTAQTMGCKASTIRLLDSTGRFLLPSAAYGLSATYMRKGPVEVKRSGLDGEVLAGKTHPPQGRHLGRALSVPAVGQGRRLGFRALGPAYGGRQGHWPDPRLF